MRTVKKVHQAVYDPIGDLVTYRAIPTHSVSYIDPFLFLNHHGPQVYSKLNNGLPFGPHPHRGMETVTFILDGDIAHYDSSGEKSVMKAGGVQWMTAGRGLIHSEVSSDEFKREGGPMEILQLWVNLKAKDKMCEPFYKGLQKDGIPEIELDGGKARMNLVSGEYAGVKGPFDSRNNIFLATIHFKPDAELKLEISADENIFFYIIRGKLTVNGRVIDKLSLVEFENDGKTLAIKAESESVLLLGHARPFNEPVVSQGPFVMNTRDEIIQAYDDYNKGKFGTWNH